MYLLNRSYLIFPLLWICVLLGTGQIIHVHSHIILIQLIGGMILLACGRFQMDLVSKVNLSLDRRLIESRLPFTTI